MNTPSFRRAYIALGLLIGIITIGVAGYMVLEEFTFSDAFYMTIQTISTVGFNEVNELTVVGEYFTSFLIIFSFGTFAYAITTFTRYVVDGALGNYYKSRKLKNKIHKLTNHVIVCGYGRNGRQAVAELKEHGEIIVVIEKSEAALADLQIEPQLLYLVGDATHDEVLESVQITQAKALLTTFPVDADNLFVVLTARQMNPTLTIISRASEEHSDTKLKRAGATNVLMPDRIGGQRMAKLVSQPDVIEFLEYIMLQSAENVSLAELSCNRLNACFEGKSIRELDIRNESGANIIGLKRSDSSFLINPLPEVQLSVSDKLFVLGTPSQVTRLEKIMFEGIDH